MRRELKISAEVIDEASLIATRMPSAQMGAVVYFTGIVRSDENGTAIVGLEYETYHAMAVRQFELLFDAMEKQWPVESVRIVHRTGLIRAGEPSLWMEIFSAHRAEAFAAGQWLIDEMKRVVPIWKKAIS